jgi:hypothetical protein
MPLVSRIVDDEIEEARFFNPSCSFVEISVTYCGALSTFRMGNEACQISAPPNTHSLPQFRLSEAHNICS